MRVEISVLMRRSNSVSPAISRAGRRTSIKMLPVLQAVLAHRDHPGQIAQHRHLGDRPGKGGAGVYQKHKTGAGRQTGRQTPPQRPALRRLSLPRPQGGGHGEISSSLTAGLPVLLLGLLR